MQIFAQDSFSLTLACLFASLIHSSLDGSKLTSLDTRALSNEEREEIVLKMSVTDKITFLRHQRTLCSLLFLFTNAQVHFI